MPTDVVWSRFARKTLLDIYVMIGLDNPAAAERLLDRIEARVARLGDQPRMGPRRRDIRPSMRVLVEGPYLILYETEPDTDDGMVERVHVVSVVDGRRDLSPMTL